MQILCSPKSGRRPGSSGRGYKDLPGGRADYQETTGPVGFAKAMRTIPVMLEICRIQDPCSRRLSDQFHQPAGIITEAVLKHVKPLASQCALWYAGGC